MSPNSFFGEGGHPSSTKEHSPSTFSVISEEGEESYSSEEHSSFHLDHSEEKRFYDVRSCASTTDSHSSPPLPPHPSLPPPPPLAINSQSLKEEKIDEEDPIEGGEDESEDRQTYQELF